ncbi:3' terminal RNA ribose 2'-O-methyltransferase Hen1 [Amorphoplanes digitatis]|uniref:Small RNA 2'-O-methyltransferase n=1 Tax=Actinoplanes digitatis TaxID=1868 RepID=A0A7W7MU68_9ACTN|nr:3' terminal RNA ribose 2'-O-methyltransferase Hen1 [Actinoplanes digitatis]MBB4767153.1 3' terminal RNA ribose 2'-O-methyltransferase Hen1 [Actinoplanes digitatis]GID95171.1 3' terminal RNA ribose 2'-O-methyltransferase Hen1 [Actinoplanes digitatis]
MLLTVTTTRRPATDLGYLLVKHPDRVHSFDVPTGTAYVLFPDAAEDRCTAALLLDVDPQRLGAARGARAQQQAPESFTLGRFVNDRPYAASSLLAGALAKVFRSALRGESKDRPELAGEAIPLEIRVPVLRCRGDAAALFAPLGWTVTADPIPLDDVPEGHPLAGDSPYVSLTLTGTLRLCDALNHLYVLMPVLDDAKHYWVAPDEIDKLLRAGEGWLAGHPEKVLITRRYLAHRRGLAASALERLDRADPDSVDAPADTVADEEAELPVARRRPLAEQRRDAVLAALAESGAARVLDLGCGGGALLAGLMADRRYTEIVGTDVSSHALDLAHRRLRLDRLPERQRGRVTLWQSALTYRDDRLRGYDAAVLMEVIEHLDPARLPALEASVFGHANPATAVVTTPNVEYNVLYEGLTGMRHSDHRFEWTRAEFQAWATRVAAGYGYGVAFRGVGDDDAVRGTPTQMAIFTKEEKA